MFRARGSAVFFVSYTRRTHRVRRISLLHPESVIRIQSVFLLYIERIFVGSFAGIADYVKKKYNKKRPIENKKTAESMNAQTDKTMYGIMTDSGLY